MRYIVIWSLAIFLFGFLTEPALAEISKVRGTRVSMECPEGFKPASNYSGFNNEPLHAALMVTEMPIPFEIATRSYTEDGLTSKGMKLISKESVVAGSYPGFLMETRQTAYGSEFAKWISVFGDNSITVLVSATCPVAEAEVFSKRLKEAVLSARFDAQAKELDPMADLPFTVSGTTSLKIAGKVQNTLLLTPSGNMTPPTNEKDDSLFIIGQALSDMEIGDKPEFARQRLKKTDSISDIQILAEKDVTVAGMPAREILASAKDKVGHPVFVLQTIAYGRGSCFIMQGLTQMSTRTRMEFEFRNIIHSLKLKAPVS